MTQKQCITDWYICLFIPFYETNGRQVSARETISTCIALQTELGS